MPRFFRTYDYKAAGAFRGVPLKLTNGWLLAGYTGDQGLIALIGFDGNPIWQKKYNITGKKVSFNGIVQAGGKIYVTGSIILSPKRSDHLLLQMDANGNLTNWANGAKPGLSFYSDYTRFAIDVLDLYNGQLLCTGWFNQTANTDFAELFVLNLTNGQLVQAAKFTAHYDSQIYDTAVINDLKRRFIYLVGVDNGSKGLFVSIGYHGSFAAKKNACFIGPTDASITQIFAITVLPNNGHLIAGTYSRAGQIGGDTMFVAHLSVNEDQSPIPLPSVVKSLGLRFGGEDKRVHRIVKQNDKWWITGFLTTSIRPFVVCLDQSLNIEWVRILQTDNKAVLSDAEFFDNNTLVFCGYLTDANNLIAPALLYTDNQLASCQTQALTWEPINNVDFKITAQPFTGFELFPNAANYAKVYYSDVAVSSIDNAQALSQCPEKEFAFFNGERMPQSPFLHLQAAGSLGVESTPGIHLRWAFLGALGDKHLPKGNYPVTKVNFNKPDDFVHLYRIPYSRQFAAAFALNTSTPIFKDHIQARWRYTVPGLGNIDVWFLDKDKYQIISNNALPAFWAAYQGSVVEIELKDALAFATELQVTATGNYTLEVETLSAAENHPLTAVTVTARQVFTQSSPLPRRLVAENLRKVRYKVSTGSVNSLSIAFEPYDTFLAEAVKNASIEHIGSFALTEDDKTAFTRLEDKPRTTVHGLWKKYNQDAFVNVSNYQKRWSKQGGLKYGIAKYLALSNLLGNPTATEQVSDDPDIDPKVTDGKKITVSYLDMLQIASTDFHVARMLGLGHLDTPKGTVDTACLYLVEYHTNGDLADGKNARPVQHLYLSLPTARKDQRFPEEVKVTNISYGLNDQDDIEMTDAQGYAPDGLARYINIFTALKTPTVFGNDFFKPNVLFQASNQTRTVFVGLEYNKAGDKDWRKPEIAHHSEPADPSNPNSPKLYLDTKGVAETAVLLFHEDGTKPALIHEETEAGIHYYAAYPINIFSRSGEPPLKAESTDETKFTKRNTLMSPSDVRVQLIQKEDPFNLILTSADEQAMLQALALNKDNTLVRLTFNYTHIQDANYDFGDQFEIFFRQEMADQVIGGMDILAAINSRQTEVVGTDYTFVSNGQIHKPVIPAAKRSRYIGGAFVHDGKRFEITDLQDSGGNYPKFTVRNIVERAAITNGSQQALTVSYIGPGNIANKAFTAMENMANAANWGSGNPLSYKIDIDTSQWEVRQEKQGSNTMKVRGIWETAKLEKLMTTYTWIDAEKYPDYPWKDEAEQEDKKTAEIHIGYKLTFDDFKLKRHKQHSTSNQRTEWYGGIVRVPFVEEGKPSKWCTLPVTKIIQEYDSAQQPTGNLVLYVGDDKIKPENLVLGESKEVNFYPGYRSYLLADPSKGFHGPAIMPSVGEGHKNTLIGLRTVDIQNSYTSPVCPPAVLMAQEVVKPAEAEMPSGPEYATPPDIYNKSTYTLNLKFKQAPFAVVVYRADSNVLSGIKPADITDVVRELFVPLTKQPLLWKEIQASTAITEAFPARWDAAKKTIVFTDFTLDGSMNTDYYYFTRDVSSNMEMGPPSKVWGPVKLVNTRPPSAPVISKVLSILGTVNEKAAIQFEMLSPSTDDRISKIRIYRADNSLDAIHLRTMKLVKEEPLVGNILTLQDDFAHEETPYGDPLHYRLVGIRTITYKDVTGVLVNSEIPSFPSKPLLASAVDTVNPKAPPLQHNYIHATHNTLLGVEITWQKTTYKGRYSLYKMGTTGQWAKIKEIDNASNQPAIVVNLADTTLKDSNLVCIDKDGNKLYHLFKVMVESASGLMSLEDKILTVGM